MCGASPAVARQPGAPTTTVTGRPSRVLWVDVGRRGALGLADASLRTLGRRWRTLVLDPRAPLRAGVGFMERGAGVRRSWCPLGFTTTVPCSAISAHFESSRAAINAWVVMPREHFGVGSVPVQRFATTREALPPRTPFIAQTPSPAGPSNAATRRLAAPLPTATSATAVPRTDVSSARRIPDPPRRIRANNTDGPLGIDTACGTGGGCRPRTPDARPRLHARTRRTVRIRRDTWGASRTCQRPPRPAFLLSMRRDPWIRARTARRDGTHLGGAVPRYSAGRGNAGGANPGAWRTRDRTQATDSRHLSTPASQSWIARRCPRPRTTPPPGDPGSPGSRGPARAQPVPASTGAPAPRDWHQQFLRPRRERLRPAAPPRRNHAGTARVKITDDWLTTSSATPATPASSRCSSSPRCSA